MARSVARSKTSNIVIVASPATERTGDGVEKRERQTDKQTRKGAQRERENSNSKTLILKDSSVRSIWI